MRAGGWKRVGRFRPLVLAALLIFVLLIPYIETDVFRLRVLTVACLAGVLTVGVTISLGYAGLFNMSQGTFFGIGAYATAILIDRGIAPFEVALLVSVAAGAASGVLLGLTSLRIRGDLWALVSMAFTVALAVVFANWVVVTNGKNGIGVTSQSFMGIALDSPTSFYYLALAGLLIALLVDFRIRHTFSGRAMIAVRYDEAAASAMGISPASFKLLAMGLSGALAGLAGSLLVATTLFVTPTSFDFLPSFNYTLFAIVGGVMSGVGGAAAAMLMTFVTEAFRSLTDYRLMIYGGVLILAIFARNGVFNLPLRYLRGRR